MLDTKQPRYLGSMLGSSIGDGLGYSKNNDKILISSNTQQSLFTANGLLYGITRTSIKGIGGDIEKWVYLSYRDWNKLQKQHPDQNNNEFYISWLFNIPTLSESRNPIQSTLDSLRFNELGTLGNPKNDNNTYDCVTRALPITLCYTGKKNIEDIFKIACKVGVLTHGNANAYLSSATYTVILSLILELEGNLKESVEKALELLRGYSGSEGIISLLNKALELSSSNTNDEEAIEILGNSEKAEECLALGVYFSLKYKDSFKQAVLKSIENTEYPNAVGSMVGGILGLIHGESGIEDKYKEKLELRDIIEEIARDLYLIANTDEKDLINDRNWLIKYVERGKV